MSLKLTKSTTNYRCIPKKCKNCNCAIYTIEDLEVIYQCKLTGTFKRNCEVETKERYLPKPEEILGEV